MLLDRGRTTKLVPRQAPAAPRSPEEPLTKRRPKTRRTPRAGRGLLWLCAALAVTFVAYIPSLRNGFINWDDNFYVTENTLIVHPTWSGLLTTNLGGNYHPLTMASLALNYKLSAFTPAPTTGSICSSTSRTRRCCSSSCGRSRGGDSGPRS